MEGAGGTGRPLAARLLADGESVVDVPAKLAARVRVFDVGHGRKTDATDAHAIAMAALRTKGLRQLGNDEDLAVLRLLADRRDELSRTRAQTLNRLHRLLTELIPGGAPRHLSALQAKALLAGQRPRDAAGRTRRALAAELIGEIEVLDGKLKQLNRRLRQDVVATGSRLLDLFGVGPAGAARILADVGDVARFADRNRFASWTGTAPIDASSGEQIRHRLSRAGNRRLNHVLYIAAIVQIRHDTPGRAYYRRKLAEGKTTLEALRCLKRRLSDLVYRQLVTDAAAAAPHTTTYRQLVTDAAAAAPHTTTATDRAGPGGHPGTATDHSSVADPTPTAGSSDRPQPGPAPATLPPTTPASPAAAPRVGAPEASTPSAPPDERR